MAPLDHFSAAGRLSFPASADLVAEVTTWATTHGMTIHEALLTLVRLALTTSHTQEPQP